MPRPGEGPITAKDAKAKADAVLTDPKQHGQSAEHEQSQHAERLDDPKHQGKPTLDPAWKQVGDDWIHATEG